MLPDVAFECRDEPQARDFVGPSGEILADLLQRRFGASLVWATDTATGDGYGSGARLEMTLSEYLDWWSGTRDGDRRLYVKDWHFVAEQRGRYTPYDTPDHFQDDWLNQWCDNQAGSGVTTADYRFLYLGPEGSWTPLHSDVLKSYSWSANVAGRKLWWLLHPELTWLIYDRTGRVLAPSLFPELAPVDLGRRNPGNMPEVEGQDLLALLESCKAAWREGPDGGPFPFLPLARALALHVDQGPGDALFVPSAWHHMVGFVSQALTGLVSCRSMCDRWG